MERYSKTAVALHWIIALLLIGAYAAIKYRHWFTDKGMPENVTAAQVHFALGFSVGVFVILRIVWRLTHRPPPSPAGPAWQRLAAKVTHGLLYFFMIAMPLTGYMGTRAIPEYLLVVPRFRDTAFYEWLVAGTLGLTWDQWREPLSFFHHAAGENVVWVLVAIHIAAALYHQFILHDRLIRRMWF